MSDAKAKFVWPEMPEVLSEIAVALSDKAVPYVDETLDDRTSLVSDATMISAVGAIALMHRATEVLVAKGVLNAVEVSALVQEMVKAVKV